MSEGYETSLDECLSLALSYRDIVWRGGKANPTEIFWMRLQTIDHMIEEIERVLDGERASVKSG